MPTLADVSKKAGVSTSTASRTFGAPHLIKEETRKRVIDAAALLKYVPRPQRLSGQRLGHQSHVLRGAIGFQYFSAMPGDAIGDNFFYAPLLCAAHEEANALGVTLVVTQALRQKIETDLPRIMRERSLAGMLLVGSAHPEVLAAFTKIVPHVVLIDVPDPDGSHDCILSDGFQGMRNAVRYLMNLGHSRIGFVMGPDAPSFQERYDGYVCAHLDSGKIPDLRLTIREEVGEDQEEQLRELLLSPERPTALIAANDCIAVSAMKVCHYLNIRIPEELSIVGFDDIAIGTHSIPQLTTVKVDKEYMGRLAIQRIVHRITEDRPTPEGPILIRTRTELIVRDSCAPPAK
jgi:DNA-binding LacI/PurR family transcriptional regulator